MSIKKNTPAVVRRDRCPAIMAPSTMPTTPVAAQMGSANILPNAAAVTHGHLVTGTSAGCAVAFGLELIAAVKGREAAEAVAKQIVIR